jgi:hypothetical protein
MRRSPSLGPCCFRAACPARAQCLGASAWRWAASCLTATAHIMTGAPLLPRASLRVAGRLMRMRSQLSVPVPDCGGDAWHDVRGCRHILRAAAEVLCGRTQAARKACQNLLRHSCTVAGSLRWPWRCPAVTCHVTSFVRHCLRHQNSRAACGAAKPRAQDVARLWCSCCRLDFGTPLARCAVQTVSTAR